MFIDIYNREQFGELLSQKEIEKEKVRKVAHARINI
jgi:hypothetical protein